jgi:hypothetical protein
VVEKGDTSGRNLPEQQAVSHTLPWPEDPPTDSSTDKETERAFSAAAEEPKEEPKQPKKLSARQLAANACLGVYGIHHRDLTSEACATYIKALDAIAKQQEHGWEELHEWAREQGEASRELGNGSAPEKTIPQVVRREITASTWQATFAAARNTTREQSNPYADLLGG